MAVGVTNQQYSRGIPKDKVLPPLTSHLSFTREQIFNMKTLCGTDQLSSTALSVVPGAQARYSVQQQQLLQGFTKFTSASYLQGHLNILQTSLCYFSYTENSPTAIQTLGTPSSNSLEKLKLMSV